LPVANRLPPETHQLKPHRCIAILTFTLDPSQITPCPLLFYNNSSPHSNSPLFISSTTHLSPRSIHQQQPSLHHHRQPTTTTMSSTTTEPEVILKSSDGSLHPVPRSVAERSMLIKNLLTDLPLDDPSQAIPIPNVRRPYDTSSAALTNAGQRDGS
jgi:hypothetical protein